MRGSLEFSVPLGTAEIASGVEGVSAVPTARGDSGATYPPLKAAGYCQRSLRDRPGAPTANCFMEWKPTSVVEVKSIVESDLANCDDEQLAIFRLHAVEPYVAPILRYGEMETVVVVARKGEEVIYWEDVEEGFNVSPIGEGRRILEHWCNQDELRHALNAWIDGRERSTKLGPAVPVE